MKYITNVKYSLKLLCHIYIQRYIRTEIKPQNLISANYGSLIELVILLFKA